MAASLRLGAALGDIFKPSRGGGWWYGTIVLSPIVGFEVLAEARTCGGAPPLFKGRVRVFKAGRSLG